MRLVKLKSSHGQQKAEMKEKVESGEVPAQQAQMMAKKWVIKVLMSNKHN